jgi:DNA-binding beta-propeller fold protein YncE
MERVKNTSLVRANTGKSAVILSVLIIGVVSITASVARSQEAPASQPTNSVIANIKVGNPLGEVVVSPDSDTVYVAHGSNVTVIDAKKDVIENAISVGTNSFGLALSSDGKTLYVSHFNNPGTVTVIDRANGNSLKTITGLDPYPEDIVLSPDETQLWVAAGLKIDQIDTATNKMVGSITVPNGCHQLAFTPDGSKVYATGTIGGKISVISTVTGIVTTPITGHYQVVPGGTTMIRNMAYVLVTYGIDSNGPSAGLWIINTVTDTVIKKVSLKHVLYAGLRAALLPGTPYLYIPELYSYSVALFDVGTKTLTGDTITCPGYPNEVAIAPNGARAYVTDVEGIDRVTVIAIK